MRNSGSNAHAVSSHESVDGGRRTFLAASLVGLASSAVVTGSAAAQDKPADHQHHHGHHDAAHAAHGDAPHKALIETALKCVGRGEVCTDHCIDLLGKGDTSLKDCIRSVGAMMPMCSALGRLAALDSPRLAALAKVCLEVCEDCEKECKKHAEHHAACKACAESCRECIDACKKVI